MKAYFHETEHIRHTIYQSRQDFQAAKYSASVHHSWYKMGLWNTIAPMAA